MAHDPQQLVNRLVAELRRSFPEWRLRDFTVVGRGLESLVCRAVSDRHGPVAIRVPWSRWNCNENDADVDNRQLLLQEATVARHLQEHGVPVPQVHLVHIEGELDFLIASYVPGDGSPVPSRELGRVLSLIHRTPLPPIRPYGQQAVPLPDILAERIARRLRVVEQHTGMRFPLPKGWHEPLYWPAAREAILHMDFRPANVLSRSGAIAAVIDWSNMLFGPPALELARIAEYGLLDDEFLEGYGSPDLFGHLPPGLEALYRLDTAVMLSVVFLSEAPDDRLARRHIERVQTLWRQLQR